MPNDLKTIVGANDRLLKALLTLLILRDPTILDDMQGIFARAVRERSHVGVAMPEVWDHILDELKIIERLAADGDDTRH